MATTRGVFRWGGKGAADLPQIFLGANPPPPPPPPPNFQKKKKKKKRGKGEKFKNLPK